MSAVRWLWERRFVNKSAVSWGRKPRTHSSRKRRSVPVIESLETLALLSAGGAKLIAAAVRLDHAREVRAERHATAPPASATVAATFTPAAVTTAPQTVSLAATPTDYTNQPLTPNLNLFNPALGTLLSVTVSYSASAQSTITSQNLSPSSPTTITASLTGSFQVNGLNEAITEPSTTLTSQPEPAGTFGSPTDTVDFPPLVLTQSATTTYTDAASLAFFTASSTSSTTTVTMSAAVSGSATAPNGNLNTIVDSSGMATVTVSYTYQPPPVPATCPTVTTIGRIGVHQQPTQLVVTFDGTVDVAKAEDPADYAVLLAGGRPVPITSATFDASTNSVTLLSSQRLNVHHDYRLSIVIPCANETTPQTVVIPFGTKFSLIGFHNHQGEFVTVSNGKITGFFNQDGVFVPVRNIPL
jgi:hypothetical protein